MITKETDDENADAGDTDADEGAARSGDDPTFELAKVRRFIMGKEPISKFVDNSRKMFLLKVSISFYSFIGKE